MAQDPAPRPTRNAAFPRWEAAFFLLFPLLAFLLLWEVLVGGKVLLPAEFLRGMSPWAAAFPAEGRVELPQWNVLQWDGMAEFFPWRLHAAREMGAGRIPLWNPFVLSGTPFLANSQSAPLYPLHFLLYLPLGEVAARMAWLAALHLSLAGGFTYMLARDWGARPVAAAVAGAAFELSGFAVAWLELPSFISVSCWIPLVLLCLGRAVREGSPSWTAGAGAGLGLMFLAGHLQIAFYGLIAAGVVWVWETVGRVQGSGFRVQGFASSQLSAVSGQSDHTHTPTHPHTHTSPRRNRIATWAHCALVGAAVVGLGLGLAAAQVLPSVELSRMSHRAAEATAEGFAGYVKLALGPRNWITLLVPDYYGLPGLNNFWGGWNYGPPNVMEYAGHVGAAAFLLAVIGLLWGRGVDRRALLAGALAVVSLLLAMGTPLAAALYFLVPGFSQSGSPARALVLFCLAQALLAGLGTEWILRRSEERWTAPLRVLGIALGVALALMLGLHGVAQASLPTGDFGELIARIAIPSLATSLAYAAGLAFLLALVGWLLRENPARQRAATCGGVAVAVVAGGLLFLSGAYNLTAPAELAYPEVPLTRALQGTSERAATLNRGWSLARVPEALLPPNASLAYRWRDAQGYDSLYLGHYRRLTNALAAPEDASPPENGNIVFVKQVGSPLFPLLSAPLVVSQRPLQREGLVLAAGFPEGPPYVYRDRYALPQAYTVPSYFAAPDAEALERLRQLGAANVGSTAVVAPQPGQAAATSTGPGAPMAAQVERLAPGRLRARTTEGAMGPLLVLTEGYAPGWRATVTAPGAAPYRARVLRTNVAFQGVLVPPGPVTVEWRYEPASFRVGLFLSLCALGVLLALALPRNLANDTN